MAKPLEGIRVIEIGNLIAGPFAGLLLGDMGADVVKIEKPHGGDYSRAMPPFVNGESSSFAVLNRNKRSLALDLKAPQAREIVLELATRSDVLIENNRPGALDAIGLGADHVRTVKPDIVYVSVSGFGQTGPYRTRAGVNLTVEAFSGVLSITGEPDQKPMRPGVQTADMFGALFGTYAVLSGLVNVLRNRGGRVADVSMVEASLAVAAWETAGYLATGEVPQRLGDHHRLNAPYSLFETRDGRWIAFSGAREHFFGRIMHVLGLEAEAADPRFAKSYLRKENEAALLDVMSPAIKRRDGLELEAALMEAGVPCSLVNDYQQVFEDAHMRSRGVLAEFVHSRMGRQKAVRNPVRFDRDGPDITRPAPLLGEHSIEILRELGYEAKRIDALGVAGVVAMPRSETVGRHHARSIERKGHTMIVDTHCHVFTDDRKKYPQIGDTARAGSIPSITEIGQTEWPLTRIEDLIAQLDEAGVNKATLVQAYFVYEYDNRYTIDVALEHANRFTAVVVLDPLDPNAPDELSRMVERQRVTGIRFMRGRLPETSLGKPETFPLWARIESLKIPVAVGDRVTDISKIVPAMERYPNVKVAFEHSWGHKVGAPPDYSVLQPLFELSKNPNVYIKTAINNIAAAREGGGTPQQLYTKLVDVFGAKRIMWSSNYPAHPKFGGVKARLDASKQALAHLSAEDQSWILGKTALAFYPALAQ